MEKTNSFKFFDPQLNQELVRLFKKAKIDHSIGKDGVIHYAAENEEIVDNELICSIRDKVFPSWQILTCPSESVDRYQDYMNRHGIPFKVELSNGEIWFLLPRKYRPHSWKLEDSSLKGLNRKKERLARSR